MKDGRPGNPLQLLNIGRDVGAGEDLAAFERRER